MKPIRDMATLILDSRSYSGMMVALKKILRLHEREINEILESPDSQAKETVEKFQSLIENVIQEGNFKRRS